MLLDFFIEHNMNNNDRGGIFFNVLFSYFQEINGKRKKYYRIRVFSGFFDASSALVSLLKKKQVEKVQNWWEKKINEVYQKI